MKISLALLALVAAQASAQGLTVQYPYSMIPGGVQSPEEFEESRASHAEHYADVGFLRPGFAKQDKAYMVSYARGKDIFWAQSTVRKGELVWSDRCGNLVRGRCGNRMVDPPALVRTAMVLPASAVPDAPQVEFEEPATLPAPIETMSTEEIEANWPDIETPETPIKLVPHVKMVDIPVSFMPAGLHPIHPEHPVHPGHPDHPPAPTPEPGTWAMGLIAIVGIAFIQRRRRR